MLAWAARRARSRILRHSHGVVITDELVQLCALKGGIVGVANIADCVSASASAWFDGPFGFALTDARVLPFRRAAGRLGIFDVPDIATGIATGLPSTGGDEQGLSARAVTA
jgi:hypothetical protein